MEKTRIATPAPQSAHEARAARGTGQKPGSAEDAAIAAGQGGGFALLLAALGGGASEQASTQAGEQAGEQVGGAVALLDGLGTTAPEAGEQALKPQPGMPDGAALAPWMLGLQPTAVQAQGAGVVMDGAAATTGGEVAALSGLAGRSGQGLMGVAQAGTQRWTSGSLVGETAMLDGAAEAAALGGTSQGMGAAAPAVRGVAARAQPWQPADGPSGAAGSGRNNAAGVVSIAQTATESIVTMPAAAQTTGLAISERGGAQQPMPLAQPGGEAEAAAPALSAAGLIVANDRQPGAAQSDARSGAGAASVGSGEHQGFEAQPAAADATPAAMAGAEDQLAEQIAEQASYWVHQKTQNAELTLDQGGRPVEVRVALTGDQAHVSLRSDQLEARQLLDAGREQLQDMLQRQGLQLAGMTVGAGGGHGAGARQDGREPGRQGAQRASVQAALPVGAAGRGSGVGERSVDIFV